MHDVLVLGASVMRAGGTKKLTHPRLLVCYRCASAIKPAA